MRITNAVRVNLSTIVNYRRKLPARQRKVLELWVLRYRAYIQRRWNSLSRGGGSWPPLKSRKGSILRNTNTMFAAMAPVLQAPAGSINEFSEKSVIVGFGGTAAHPAGPSIMQVALWHQLGMGNNPKREIIVPPDSALKRAMINDMKRAIAQ